MPLGENQEYDDWREVYGFQIPGSDIWYDSRNDWLGPDGRMWARVANFPEPELLTGDDGDGPYTYANPNYGLTPEAYTAFVQNRYGIYVPAAIHNDGVFVPHDLMVQVAAMANAQGGDFVSHWLDSGGGVTLMAGGFLALTALPALTAAIGETFAPIDALETIYNTPGFDPIFDVYNTPGPTFDAPVDFQPSYPMPEPTPPPEPVYTPEPVSLTDYPMPAPEPPVEMVEYPAPEYPMPEPVAPPEPVNVPEPVGAPDPVGIDPSLPSPTVPPSSPGATTNPFKLPALSDLPKLVTAAVGAGLAIKTAQAKNDLAQQLLKSQSLAPQSSLLPSGSFFNPLSAMGFGAPVDGQSDLSQTLGNVVRSPWFWAIVGGGALLAIAGGSKKSRAPAHHAKKG